MTFARLLVVALLALAACRRSDAGRPALAAASGDEAAFLDQRGVRRATLLASLTNHDNEYSRLRIASYGFEDSGWDALPVWNPRSAPVDAVTARALSGGASIAIDAQRPRLWNGVRPRDLAGWVDLGRRVFFEHPLRAEVYIEHALRRPELLAACGVRPSADGSFAGLRVFEDVDGRARVGITCATCHTAIVEGRVVDGAARREFDYGRLRLQFHASTGAPLDATLAERMARWGPGRADVTGDETEDPVAIPDLWGLRHQSYFTQAGTLRHRGPMTLAVRQETQLIETAHQRVRPPREFAWALAMYLYALEAPAAAPRARDAALVDRGRVLFDEQCRNCHHNEAGGGDVVPAARVGTDPALATGSARGTGMYRPPALIRVRDAAPYLHHGVVPSLSALFDPERLRGGAPGHPYGTRWPARDREAIVALLETL